MKCIVPAANVRILAKAIHALSKVGDEMYIEPQKSTLSFRAVNMANSAYADFTFFENYFSYYVYGDLQENDALKCKISMRSAIGVFKASNVIDKQVETCHIMLEPDATEILFILKYKNSITKTHLLPILDCEILQTAYDKDCASIKLLCQPKVLGDALQNFHQQLVEITLEVLAQKLLLRNYVDDTLGISNTTRTQLALGKGEFDRYDIGSEKSITFCMKEFKSMLNFAETIGVLISIYFEEPGRPVIFALKNPSFEADLVLSTLSSDTDSQTDTISNSKQERSMKRRPGNKRAPRTHSNKSSSRIQDMLTKCSKAKESTIVKDAHPSAAEEENQKHQQICKKQDNSSINAFSTSTKENQIVNEVGYSLTAQNSQGELPKCSTPSSEISKKFNKKSTNEEESVNSIFARITDRQSINAVVEKRKKSEESSVLEDRVPNSPQPPIKKAHLIFQKCFQTTFDPRTLPGYNVILAEDSDDSCNE